MKRCPICAKSYESTQRFCSVHGLPLAEEMPASTEEAGELTGYLLDGRYSLKGLAGRGGMGVVYEAENLRIGRRCAVKVLHREMLTDAKMRMRLFREMQATSRIRHPNVVEILDFGDDERVGSFFVMEYLEGQSLAQVIRAEGALPVPTVIKIAAQLTSALNATHARGLIHRDLKPSNVRILPGGLVKVLDFGLVKPFEPETAKDFVTITTGGITFGTPWYMSPEQATFQPLDPRSDIYSLGVILYEMVVGHPPFMGDNPVDLIDAHRNQPVPLPSKLDPPVLIPAALEVLILKALSKDPDMRYGSMSEILDELHVVAEQAGMAAGELALSDQASGQRPRRGSMPEVSLDEWTLPIPPPDIRMQNLHAELLKQMDVLVDRVVPALRAVIPHYHAIDSRVLSESVRMSLQSGLRIFEDSPPVELPEEIRRLADERSGQEFTPTEFIGALWVELSTMRRFIREVAGDDLERHPELEDQLDQRILSFVLKLVDYYFARYHSRLIQLNEALSGQNEELLRLRGALTDQVDQVSRQMVEAEQLKARVVESISSGLILMEHASQRVKIFNKAMERLTGVTSAQAVGRPINEVLTFIEGVPYEEFMEQLRLHGEVGLRKLWIRLPGGAERAVYLRGQAITEPRDGHTSTLFVVDDVTEREHIIESFSSYLSRDVVEKVLRRGKASQPAGEPRNVALLAVSILGFRSMLKEMGVEGVVELLSDYLRSVGEAVFHHGGVIDSVVADAILVYFDNIRTTCAPAIEAAKELIGRLEGVNQERAARKAPAISVGVGIHVGQVFVVNVGGKRRMAHIVVGEAALVAEALKDVASAAEILVSADVASSVGGAFSLENGPVVSVKGQSKPVEAFHVAFEITPIVDPVH
jgi:PAS domain S-box-containing protein